MQMRHLQLNNLQDSQQVAVLKLKSEKSTRESLNIFTFCMMSVTVYLHVFILPILGIVGLLW
jgi:hypothetical protein